MARGITLLAPQVPSMHWGWSAGTVYCAWKVERDSMGLVGTKIHALGDDNHTPGEMEVMASIEDGVLMLDVEADVLGSYNQLSVAAGLINHGEDRRSGHCGVQQPGSATCIPDARSGFRGAP